MNTLIVKVDRREVKVDKRNFVDLLDFPPVMDLNIYQEAIIDSKITLSNLKILAEKSCVPYPLFFAPRNVVLEQINNKNISIDNKIPSKKHLALASRGELKPQDIELIVRDLSRKQEFLKRRVLQNEIDNNLIGLVAKKMAQGVKHDIIANEIRSAVGIDLEQLRKQRKDQVLDYLCKQMESRNVLVSFSSYNYMPQAVGKNLGFSGICIKDKKFPYIFINRRDGDENPKILETDGRQIFTLVCMLVCMSMNKFALNMNEQGQKDGSSNTVFSIAGEILIPKIDLDDVKVSSVEDLKKNAGIFKVTPSMFLMRLIEINSVSRRHAKILFNALKQEIKDIKVNRRNRPNPTTAYGKYNGERLSKEVVRAHMSNRISASELRNVLFRRGRSNMQLVSDYCVKYK